MADDDFKISPVHMMASSCAGALLTSLFMTPLDVVKIRLQTQQKAMQRCFLYCNGLMDHLCPVCVNGSGVPSSNWYQRPGYFTGTVDAILKISQHEGVSSLWSGLPPTLVMAVPTTVIYFTTYEELRSRLMKKCKTDNQKTIVPLLSGMLARTWAVTIVSPLELIRTKMQSKKLGYAEVGSAVQDLVRHRGWLSLWKGLGATLLRDVPFSGLYWFSYETLKKRYVKYGEPPTLYQSFSIGAISGTVAGVLTLPFDVVKTHRQIELGEMEIYADRPTRASSTFSIIFRLYRSNGITALFSGIVPRIIKVAPACAIMISSYEYGKQFFRKRTEGSEVG